MRFVTTDGGTLASGATEWRRDRRGGRTPTGSRPAPGPWMPTGASRASDRGDPARRPRQPGRAAHRLQREPEHRVRGRLRPDRMRRARRRGDGPGRHPPPRRRRARSSFAVATRQEAMPGEPLPQPLEIEVASACGPTEGAKVEFTADGGGKDRGVRRRPRRGRSRGHLHGGHGCRRPRRRSSGCSIRPARRASESKSRSSATPDGLLEEPTTACFTGRLSVASEVEYDGGCDHLATADTVTDALDALCANDGLYYVSGDGQEAGPVRHVPHTLQARVANGDWPSPGVKVLFAVSSRATGPSSATRPSTPRPWWPSATPTASPRSSGRSARTGTQRVEARLERGSDGLQRSRSTPSSPTPAAAARPGAGLARRRRFNCRRSGSCRTTAHVPDRRTPRRRPGRPRRRARSRRSQGQADPHRLGRAAVPQGQTSP